MLIVTCATVNYIDKLTLLLSSAAATNPKCNIRVHCPGWPIELIQAARHTYPQYRFIPEPAPIDFADTVTKNKRSGSVLQSKPRWLLDAYNATNKHVLWVDADTLLLGPLDPLIKRVDSHGDYGVTHRPSAHDFAKFAVAVLYFARTTPAARLLRMYATLTEQNTGRGGWYHDQLALLEATKHCTATLVALAEREHSIQGNRATILLSRRPSFDVPKMYAELQRRHIKVIHITGALV